MKYCMFKCLHVLVVSLVGRRMEKHQNLGGGLSAYLWRLWRESISTETSSSSSLSAEEMYVGLDAPSSHLFSTALT